MGYILINTDLDSPEALAAGREALDLFLGEALEVLANVLSASLVEAGLLDDGATWKTPKDAYRLYGQVFARDQNQCRYCRSTKDLSIDHLTPRVQGGTDALDNLVVACRSCNSRKGPRTPEQAGMVLLPRPAAPQET